MPQDRRLLDRQNRRRLNGFTALHLHGTGRLSEITT